MGLAGVAKCQYFLLIGLWTDIKNTIWNRLDCKLGKSTNKTKNTQNAIISYPTLGDDVNDIIDYQVLVDIVKTAEGGQYLELLLVKDMSKNLEKQEVWMKITALFSQV